jgi:aconitate hydratase
MNDLKKTLNVGKNTYQYYSLNEAQKKGLSSIGKLPKSLKILLENILRHQNGSSVTWEDAQAIDGWTKNCSSDAEIAYFPARVLMQDFTGVPAVVDLAALREGMKKLGGNVQDINPLSQVDLVIDHSVSVEHYGTAEAFEENVKIEYERNKERYNFLKWGQGAFKNFRVVPPGTGIVHQVNLEYLASVVYTKENNDKELVAYPDTLVGTDSHTTMINGLSVLGWGVGGIEAEAAMLGQSVTMLIPEVVGMKLTGRLTEGTTATDLVLTVVEMLRKHGVVGKFVEFYGEGMSHLSLANRATIANMAPEYGATCGFFPVDDNTLEYLRLSGREEENIALVEAYSKEQGLWYEATDADPLFSSIVELDLGEVVPCISGPKRPQDKIVLSAAADTFGRDLNQVFKIDSENMHKESSVENKDFSMKHGNVVVAAITSCTNTSNPSVLMAAGLVAKKAYELGLKTKPWVKTSLAPGSKVVTDYLIEAGLQEYLDHLGFTLVGYGCTTCIGNTGPLMPEISKSINENNIVACSVLSGNRNFEGRISPDVKANYLASPPLVVAYALAGNLFIDVAKDSLGKDKAGNDVYLKDIWPTDDEISEVVNKYISSDMYRKRYENVFEGDESWQKIETSRGEMYDWDSTSTYIQNPPFFEDVTKGTIEKFEVENASMLALLGDSVTTDHISPAGAIKMDGPAGEYLKDNDVKIYDFNSFGSRRGNHEVMMRGTFANIRIRNKMVPGVEGGYTKFLPTGETMSIYDAAMKYKEKNTQLVVIGGKEYGTGSSRDWAAKGTLLLGVKSVITESYERIHRSNLIGMGVLPLQFAKGEGQESLGLDGSETINIKQVGELAPKMNYEVTFTKLSGDVVKVTATSRIDTEDELSYFKNGGILQYVLRRLKDKE